MRIPWPIEAMCECVDSDSFRISANSDYILNFLCDPIQCEFILGLDHCRIGSNHSGLDWIGSPVNQIIFIK